MLTPNEAYQYDSTFRRVVDLMCAYLSEYQITPSELRQAAIIAATMHENLRIKEQDKQAGLEQDYNMMLKYNCICGYKGSNKDLHSHTCQDYNWEVTHPKPEHCHIFVGTGYGYGVCQVNDCGMSDVYYNHEYNKKQPLPKIVSDTDGWRDDY